jgi:peptide/nickel transport system ATP-binding protein
MNLTPPDQGDIIFDGRSVGSRDLSLKEFRRQAQMVFQDSYASLNPRLTIEDSVAFAPQVHGVSKEDAIERARDLLRRVGLDPNRFAERYPHELSGGQRQRVNIARALALQPRLIILDEAVSALDKSVEAQVLNLLLDLKEDFGLTYVFISHDLNVVRYISDRVMVMYLGQIVEIGDCETLFKQPKHPYTRALLSSVPSMDPDNRTEEPPLSGDPPNPINPPSGCRFHTRCVHAQAICSQTMPALVSDTAGHGVACLMHVAGSGHTDAPRAAQEVA